MYMSFGVDIIINVHT